MSCEKTGLSASSAHVIDSIFCFLEAVGTCLKSIALSKVGEYVLAHIYIYMVVQNA